MMKTNEIYTAFISWRTGRKRRPILIIKNYKNDFDFYRITSKYKNKSNSIKKNYYPIKDWRKSGLAKASYIDIGEILNLEIKDVNLKYIGQLTLRDRNDLAAFINQRYQ